MSISEAGASDSSSLNPLRIVKSNQRDSSNLVNCWMKKEELNLPLAVPSLVEQSTGCYRYKLPADENWRRSLIRIHVCQIQTASAWGSRTNPMSFYREQSEVWLLLSYSSHHCCCFSYCESRQTWGGHGAQTVLPKDPPPHLQLNWRSKWLWTHLTSI